MFVLVDDENQLGCFILYTLRDIITWIFYVQDRCDQDLCRFCEVFRAQRSDWLSQKITEGIHCVWVTLCESVQDTLPRKISSSTSYIYHVRVHPLIEMQGRHVAHSRGVLRQEGEDREGTSDKMMKSRKQIRLAFQSTRLHLPNRFMLRVLFLLKKFDKCSYQSSKVHTFGHVGRGTNRGAKA